MSVVPTTSAPFVRLPDAFKDERGAIQTLVNGEFNAVQVITSKRGTVRANHYHKAGSHYMFVVNGAMRYYERPHGSPGAPSFVDVQAGQMVFTPPLVEHAVYFPEDTTFLNITLGSRLQEAYENDLVRVALVDPGTADAHITK